MKRFNILLIVLALGVITSCEKFFTLTPNYEVPVDNIYKTAQDFDIAVVGCYAKLQGQVNYYTELCEYRSDNMFLSAPTAGTQDRYDIDQFKDNASNGILEEAWANFNNGVYRCNMVLDRIDGADFDEALKNQYKGEAMFIRAFTYFNMYRIWGGVPTTRKVVTVAESLTIGRSSEEDMYNFIAGDLEDIVEGALLPASYSGAGVGRATLGAAKALLAKVYLTFGKHQEAATLLQSMLGSYELLSNVADVFDVANESNKEIIFSVRFNKEVPGEGHGAWFSIANLSDDSGRTDILDNLYESNDARKELIEYKKVDGVNAYLMKKFFDQRDATNKNYGNDQIILRYADVLLMYAEALNEVSYSSDQQSEAMKALNAVHTRAGLAPLDIADLPNQDAFRRAICKERQMEFPYEGHRWYDVVRMGYAKEFAAAEGHTIQDYQLVYPIPNTELERINNTALLWQNSNY
mgnify:FL=1